MARKKKAFLLLALFCCAISAQSGGPSLKSNARAAPLLGEIGVTTVGAKDVYSGVNFPVGTTIAGPYEAGFDSLIDPLLTWLGCSPSSKGYISGGINTQTALEILNFNCGADLPTVANGVYKSLMFANGAHSPPDNSGCTSPPGGYAGQQACSNPRYHFHQNFTSLYDPSAPGHSTVVGKTTAKSVDVRFIYGKLESTGKLPTDLDACSAHFGVTPDSNGQSVYHHHVQDSPPFAVGCYGPSADNGLVTLEQCRTYYSTCGDGEVTLRSTKGSFQYDPWCPCYARNGSNAGSPALALGSARAVNAGVALGASVMVLVLTYVGTS